MGYYSIILFLFQQQNAVKKIQYRLKDELNISWKTNTKSSINERPFLIQIRPIPIKKV